jgi:phosphatidylserine decarboxylase
MVTRLRTAGGLLLGVKQISGKVARHIVCPITAGQRFARGERFGMIKFGSTTELIVPTAEVEKVCVAKGDRVKGGVTVLVRATRA